MKTKILLSVVTPLLCHGLIHAAIWSATASNSDWNNAANWDTPPINGSSISIGNSNIRDINYTGSHDYESLTFNGDEVHLVTLRNGAALDFNIAGGGLLKTSTANHSIIVQDSSSIKFSNNANAGNVRIINYSGSILFTENATAIGANIHNVGDEDSTNNPSRVIFSDNSNARNANITNFGTGGSLIFTDNASAGLLDSTVANSAMLVNDTRGRISFEGHSTSAKARLTNSGNFAQIIFTDNSRVGELSGNTNITNSGKFAEAIFEGNATSLGINVTNTGAHAETIARGNFKALAGGKFRIDSSGTSSLIRIIGQAEIASEYYIHAGGNLAGFYVGENALLSGFGRLSIGGTGNYGTNIGVITDYARIMPASGTTNINSMGNLSEVYIEGFSKIDQGSNATVYINANGSNATRPSLLVIRENATINATSINVNGSKSIAKIGGNANITLTATNGIILDAAKGVSLTIGDNAHISGTAITGNLIKLSNTNNNASVVIGGYARISNGRIDASSGSSVRIQDNVIFSDVRFVGRNSNYIIAMDKIPLTIDGVNDGGVCNIFFEGNSDQELIIAGSLGAKNIVFNDNGIIRGSVTNNGNGTLDLSKQNNITGNVTINNGTLAINHAQALETATLVINNGSITYGVSGNLKIGGLGGTGNFAASLDNYDIGSNGHDSDFSGNLSGTGNITKTGSGVLAFSGDTSDYQGALTVNEGTLALFGSNLTNATSTTVNTNAALRIGSGQSTLGKLSLAADSILDIHVSQSGGNLSIGNLFVSDLQGSDMSEVIYRTSGTRLASGEILNGFLTTSDGNITAGTDYQKVKSTNTQSFLMNTTQNGSNVDFNLTVLTNSLADYALNANHASIGRAIDRIIEADPTGAIAEAADYADDPTAVFDMINPAGLSSMSRLVYQQTNTEIDTISKRLDIQRHLNSTLRQNSQVSDAILRISSSIQSFQVPASSLLVNSQPIPVPGSGTSPSADFPHMQTPWSAYVAATASRGDMDGDREAAGYDYRQAGLSLGLDKPIGANQGIAGLQISYHHGKSNLDKPSEGNVKLNSIRLAGYAGWLSRSNLSFQSHIALSYHDYESERHTFDFDGSSTTVGASKGDTTAYGAAISGELGKIFETGKTLQWKHGPYARLTYDYLRIDSFTESGTVSSLHFSNQTPDSLRSILGWKLFFENTTNAGTTLLFSARLGWAHEFNNPNQSIRARFVDYGMASFTVRGPDTRRDSAILGLGIQAYFRNGRFLSLQYQGDLNGDYSNHSLNAAMGWRF